MIKKAGKLMFLRFVPASEKRYEDIQEEVHLLESLKLQGYNVPEIIKSIRGEKLVIQNTPWGEYYAVVFEGVGERSLENVTLTETLAFAYGAFLSEFHSLSKKTLNHQITRKSVLDHLDDMELKVYGNAAYPNSIFIEIIRLRNEFEKLSLENETYGLIHYDFELDNIMVDLNSETLYAIDFDDSMYGFYGQDIERAVNSIQSEIDFPESEAFIHTFLEGYQSNGGSITHYLENKTLFKSFADLYSYVRVSESIKESWDHEPEWMINLREKLIVGNQEYINELSES